MKTRIPSRISVQARWLKKKSLFPLLLLSSLIANPVSAADLDWPIPQEAFGVWDKRGEYLYSGYVPEHVKGMGIHLDWADLQPKAKDEKYFDWSHFEDAISWAANNKVHVYFKVYPVTGGDREDAFPAFFDSNDKKLFVKSWKVNGHWYPDYKSSNYKEHYQRMVQAFGDWVYSLPENKRKWVSHIFVQTGNHGDPGPYKTWNDAKDIPKDHRFDVDTWFKWRLEIFFPAYKKAFQKDERNTPLAFNGANPTKEDTKPIYKWIDSNIENYGLKPSDRVARGTHLDDESQSINWYRPRSIDPSDKIIFSFNEATSTDKKKIAQENDSMFMFWSMMTALQTGLSIVDASKALIDVPEYEDHFTFFNKYAGQIFSKDATDAYIFFHKGLDILDYDEFPKDVYGDKSDPDKRFKNMWKKYAKEFGARKPEEGLYKLRHDKTEMNDFGIEIHRGNYGRFINQYEPDDTSQAVWRVEDPGEKFTHKSSIYSRFGRQIKAGSNKDGIYLNFSKDFFKGGHDGSYDVEFNVRYYDKGKGKFTFYYDGLGGKNTVSKTIKLKDSKDFKVAKFTITDGKFDGRGKNGSDFHLICDDKDVVITSIEVHRSFQ